MATQPRGPPPPEAATLVDAEGPALPAPPAPIVIAMESVVVNL
jgi:hypothetical protein